MKQKCSSDVKGSLWNHLDKHFILWDCEAPLFWYNENFGVGTMQSWYNAVLVQCKFWTPHKRYMCVLIAGMERLRSFGLSH